MKTILVIFLNIPLRHSEVEKFKVALNNCLNWQYDILLNHVEGASYNYRYPAVQYRSHNGFAALFSVNEGVDFLQNLLISNYLPEQFGSNYQIIKGNE